MLEGEICELEERLASPGVRTSVDTLESIVSEQFVEFGSSGHIYTKRDVIRQMLAAPNITVTFTDFRVLAVSSDVALATYRTPNSLRSSVWRREGEFWRIVFHQGTTVTGGT